jgi:hypothetical protein
MFLFFLTLSNAAAATTSHKDDSFQALLKAKVFETSSFLFSKSQFLNPIFDEYGPRSQEIMNKFKNKEASKRNLNRMISELQDEWKSTVSLSQSTWGLIRRSDGAGSGAGLHLIDFGADNLAANVDTYIKHDLESVFDQEVVEYLLFSSEELDHVNNHEFKSQAGSIGLKKRSITTLTVGNAIIFKQMFQSLMTTMYTFTVKFPLESVYNLFSQMFIMFVHSLITKIRQDPDLLISRPGLHDEIEVISRHFTSGVLQECFSHLPGKSLFLFGSFLFVAVPTLIALVARMIWNQFHNHDFE